MPKIKQSFLTIVIGLALAAGLSYAATWTGPTANPPLNNTEAPLNAGTASQAKSGNLAVGTSVIPTVSLNVGGASNFTGVSQFLSRAIFVDKVGIGTVDPRAELDVAGNVRIANGTQCDGCFLVSDADGLASWTDIGLGSGGGGGALSVNKNHGAMSYWGSTGDFFEEFPKTNYFIVSAGVTKLQISVAGGGGSGGVSIGGIGYNGGGGGGGGGYVDSQEISVSPGEKILVVAGSGGANGGIGQPGGTSSFGKFIVATGGQPGKNATKTAPGKGGIGGKVTINGVLKEEYSGWDGTDGASNIGGGGGGCNITRTSYYGGNIASLTSSGEQIYLNIGNICGGGGSGVGAGVPGDYGGQGLVQINW